ncbi:protein of unknown function [Burkholderia multivorans]
MVFCFYVIISIDLPCFYMDRASGKMI